jgi:hypothetical protein
MLNACKPQVKLCAPLGDMHLWDIILIPAVNMHLQVIILYGLHIPVVHFVSLVCADCMHVRMV